MLGCFHDLAIVNLAAMDVGCRYLFDIEIFVSFEISVSYSSSIFNFLRKLQLHRVISHQECPGIPFSLHLGQHLLFALFDNSYFAYLTYMQSTS